MFFIYLNGKDIKTEHLNLDEDISNTTPIDIKYHSKTLAVLFKESGKEYMIRLYQIENENFLLFNSLNK